MNIGVNIDLNRYQVSPPDLTTAEGIKVAILQIKNDYFSVSWDNKEKVLQDCHNRLEYLLYYYLPPVILGFELEIDNWTVKVTLKSKVTKEEYFYHLDFEPDFNETLDTMFTQARANIVEGIYRTADMFDMYAKHDLDRMMYLTDLKFNKLELGLTLKRYSIEVPERNKKYFCGM